MSAAKVTNRKAETRLHWSAGILPALQYARLAATNSFAKELTMRLLKFFLLLSLLISPARFAFAQDSKAETFDVLIKNGTVYDGTGARGRRADVGIRGDRIVAVGNLKNANAKQILDANGLAVAPGFINMLSWSTESLITDPRSMSEIKQGVTTEIFGEGESMGPLNDEMKRRMARGGDVSKIEWTTLAEYLQFLERRGVTPNVASFIGATTIREYVIGLEDKPPTPEQLEQMRQLVRREMEAGALGIGSSLIYAPAFYAKTDELIAMCKVAAEYKGMYISHIRSEGDKLFEALQELITISREAKIPAEVYHLKAAGRQNWSKEDRALQMIEDARRQGLRITADMYTYTAGATGLNACLPPWALDGGYDALFKRLRDPETRKRIAHEIVTPTKEWENFYVAAGADGILFEGFRNEKLRQYIGKTLAEVARARGTSPEETIMDLMLEDQSRVDTIFFLMSEDNIKKQLRKPWVAFGSDAASQAAEGNFLKAKPHPRAYGNFARLLGKYVRDEKILTLEDAIHRLSALPATNLHLDHRGFLQKGMYADVVIFDPRTISDRATYENPHQYAVGVRDVFVNGVQVLKDGEHTGAKPGRALWGAGKIK
jgi:N-acyl-D-amino-acid deacylase